MSAQRRSYIIGSHIVQYRGGLRIAHDTVVKYLRDAGYIVVSHYGSLDDIITIAPSHPRIPIYDVLYTTWYIGLTPAVALASYPCKRVVWHCFCEGIPRLPQGIDDILKTKMVYIAPTRFIAEMLERVGLKPRAIYNPGVDPARLIPNTTFLRLLNRLKKGRRMLLYIAHNVPRKGIGKLIEAARIIVERERVRDILVYILTNTIDRDVPESIRSNVVVDLSMFGVDDSYIAALYRAADLYVHASMSEGLGLPIMEAQCCGLPVVIVDAEPMNEVCTDRWCFKVRWRRIGMYWWMKDEELVIIHEYDPEELAKTILDALDRLDSFDRDEIARRSMDRYLYMNTLRGFENIVDEVIEEVEK